MEFRYFKKDNWFGLFLINLLTRKQNYTWRLKYLQTLLIKIETGPMPTFYLKWKMSICLYFHLIQTKPMFIFWLKCNSDKFLNKCKPDKCLFRFKGKLDFYLFCKSSAKQTMLTFVYFFLLKCKPDQFLLFIQMKYLPFD